MNYKTIKSFHAVNEDGANGTTYINGGISVDIASVYKNEHNKSNPEELLGMSLATCMHSSLKFILFQDKLSNNSRVDVLVSLVLNKDSKLYEFKIDLYLQIEDMTLEQISNYLTLTKERCPVSKLFNNSTNYNTYPLLYGSKITK